GGWTRAALVGFCFGLAVGVGFWLSRGRMWAVRVVLVTAVAAWAAAIQVAIRLQRTADDDPHLIAASLVAGAVGAGITHFGCALFARELRRPAWVALTVVVGAAAGMLLYASQRKLGDEWLLYTAWQPAVAFGIGSGLARGQTRRVCPPYPVRSAMKRARGGPASSTMAKRTVCRAITKDRSAVLEAAMMATESMPPGLVAR